jgi:protein TonB
VNERTPKLPKRWRTPLIVAVVAAAHLGVFAVIARITPTPPVILPPPFDVFLAGPILRPPPPPEPAKDIGGGAPAAPSRTHVPLKPPVTPPDVAAPPTPAPEQPLVVGTSPETSPTPGQGQGGEGTGNGGGAGAGTGPGSGTVRARLVTAPSARDLARLHPAGAGSRGPGRVSVTCQIRLDTRLDECRVVSETPSGQGFGTAGVRAAALYRFQPPSRAGRAEVGEITIQIEFGGVRR